MAFKKGDPKPPNSGIKKGQKKTETLMLKEMVFGALKAGGGQGWLQLQMTENPAAFMTLLGKFVPKDVNLGGQAENPVVTTIKLIALGSSDTNPG